jgi:hypothetical protein
MDGWYSHTVPDRACRPERETLRRPTTTLSLRLCPTLSDVAGQQKTTGAKDISDSETHTQLHKGQGGGQRGQSGQTI